MMLINMDIHSIITNTKPPNMLWVPKKTNDHSTFKNSWIANIRIAIRTSFRSKPSLQTKNKDIPIRTYSVLHIGPKAQFGGVHPGLGKETYQVVISFKV